MLQKTGSWPPNYKNHIQWRAETLRLISTDEKLLQGAQTTYLKDPAQFIDDWVDTIDPRNASSGQLVRMPFRLFPRQFDLIDFFHDCLGAEAHGLVEKSRDMGASWSAIAYAVWLFLWRPGSSVGFGSRKAQLVDRIGDMDSLFEKIRHCINALPPSVNPAEIAGRIFTSKEEEELPEYMRDGNVLRRKRGALTNEACVNRVCDLIARGVTETDARQYVGVPATEWGRWRLHNESNLLEKIAFAIKLQHIATADECIKILSQLREERRVARQNYNTAMREYRRELAQWDAAPKDDRGECPAEPVYDGPLELDVRMDVAMVTHLQWKLESLSKEHAPKKELNMTQNIYQEIKDATTPQEAMQGYIKLIDQRPE